MSKVSIEVTKKSQSQYCNDISIVTNEVMENLISNMGMGQKQMSERYADYPASHDQHFYYTYEPASPSHGHASSTKHHHGGHKNNAAMSALTLLAFLFFLHILQQCLKDHMNAMSTPPVVIMTAGKEGNEHIGKTSRIKLDKTGVTKIDTTEIGAKFTMSDQKIDSTDSFNDDEKHLMKIPTSEHRVSNAHKFNNIYKRDGLKSPLSGFSSAMDED